MNTNEQKNLDGIEQDFISRLKIDMMYIKNQLQKSEAEIAEKNVLLKQKDAQISELRSDLKKALDAYKIKDEEFKCRVATLEEELQPQQRQQIASPVLTRALNTIGVKITAVE